MIARLTIGWPVFIRFFRLTWLDIFKHAGLRSVLTATLLTESLVKAPLLTMVHTLCCCHCTSQPLFPSVPSECNKLFCDPRNHCKRVLKNDRSNYDETTHCSVASQLIESRDFWRICNSVLNRGSLPYLLFLMAQRS